MSKLRVCHIPQLGVDATFKVEVNSVVEAKKVMDLLSCYDLFQLEHKIKPDFSNICMLQQWNEEEQDWVCWETETDDGYFDDVDEYLEDNVECQLFAASIFGQLEADPDYM